MTRLLASLPSALILISALLAQSAVPATQPQTFHVQGTITNTSGEPIFRVKVEFQSKDPNPGGPNERTPDIEQIKVMDTDAAGFYQTDLPLGDYTMTAQALGFRPYRRPFFRVPAPTRLTFDVTLRDIAACDTLVFNGPGTVTPDEWAAGQKDSCLREDVLPLPSHAAPFQLSLRYGSRNHDHGVYSYDAEKNGDEEISVAYNQFTLEADKVIFDPRKKTIAASSNVIAWDEPDTIQRGDAATFRIDNDRVVRVDPPPTFHVKGTIADAGNTPGFPLRLQIKFQSKRFDKIISSNDAGAYEADLDVGEYSMIASNNFLKTRRIQLRAASPSPLSVNGVAYPRRLTCDIVVGGPDAANAFNDVCGGEDSFEIPSGDGTFLHLYIQFERRKRSDEEYVYSGGEKMSGDLLTPVFVEYNYFSLQANEVTYSLNTRILKASGNVVVTAESGATERFDSASFQIENGHLKPLR